MSAWSNGIGHFKTITHHKMVVMRHCFKVGLYKQGLLHDLSKYSPAEFKTGIAYYQGTRSPNTAERDDKGYSPAWLHHKGRNKHHYEYWMDVKGNGNATLEGKPMPTRYVIEMFCDRVAASKVYQGEAYTDASALEYFRLEHSIGNILMDPATRRLLEQLLIHLANEGEEETFKRIKNELVRPRYVYSKRTVY